MQSVQLIELILEYKGIVCLIQKWMLFSMCTLNSLLENKMSFENWPFYAVTVIIMMLVNSIIEVECGVLLERASASSAVESENGMKSQSIGYCGVLCDITSCSQAVYFNDSKTCVIQEERTLVVSKNEPNDGAIVS